MPEDLGAAAPAPALTTVCGQGVGLAVCPILRLVATSCKDDNTVSIFALPGSSSVSCEESADGGLARVCTLGGPESPAPLRFEDQTDGQLRGFHHLSLPWYPSLG